MSLGTDLRPQQEAAHIFTQKNPNPTPPIPSLRPITDATQTPPRSAINIRILSVCTGAGRLVWSGLVSCFYGRSKNKNECVANRNGRGQKDGERPERDAPAFKLETIHF